MTDSFEGLSREAGLAAAHIGIGVTALGDANYAEDAYYYQAFFALSIGFERSAKLALVLEHALQNAGTFPPHNVVRDYGHKLDKLLERADAIAVNLNVPPKERLPRDRIHGAIISVLTDFASNVTRYYNLDSLTGNPRVAREDAISQWHRRVTEEVITRHYTERAAPFPESGASQSHVLTN